MFFFIVIAKDDQEHREVISKESALQVNIRQPVIAPATIRRKEIHVTGLSFFALLRMTKSQLMLLTRMDSFNHCNNNTVADAAVYRRLVLKLLNTIK